MNAKSGLYLALLSLGLLASPRLAMADEDTKEESAEDTAESEADGDSSDEKKAPEAESLVAASGYKKGFFISDGGVNTLSIQSRLQLRSQYTNVDQGGDSRGHEHAFSLARARLTLVGGVLTDRLTYKIQTHFDQGDFGLKDYFIDYRVGEGDLRVRMGQYKMPFTRQFIQSTAVLEFVERNIMNNYVGNSRDIGFQVHNNIESMPKTEWVVGVFNGTGDRSVLESAVVEDPMTMETEVVNGTFSNVPGKIRPAVVLRVGHNSEGVQDEPYSEADITGGDFRYSVAAAALTHFQYGVGQASTRAGFDFAVKQDGMSASGGVFADLQGADIANLSYAGLAGYAQAGYMINEDKQVALLYATISKDGGDNQQELSASFSHFEFGHNLKWQTDLTYLHTDEGAKRQDIRGRSQVQLAF